MNNSELTLYWMQWLGEHGGTVAVLAMALIPLAAFAVIGYALHVVKRALDRGDKP